MGNSYINQKKSHNVYTSVARAKFQRRIGMLVVGLALLAEVLLELIQLAQIVLVDSRLRIL